MPVNAEIMGRRITLIPQQGLRLDVTGRNNLLKLATRMVRNYTVNVTACSENMWMPLPISGGENTLVKTSLNMDDPGVPQGVAVTIATSERLDFPHADIFIFLSNAQTRNKVRLDNINFKCLTKKQEEAAALEVTLLMVHEWSEFSIGLCGSSGMCFLMVEWHEK